MLAEGGSVVVQQEAVRKGVRTTEQGVTTTGTKSGIAPKGVRVMRATMPEGVETATGTMIRDITTVRGATDPGATQLEVRARDRADTTGEEVTITRAATVPETRVAIRAIIIITTVVALTTPKIATLMASSNPTLPDLS